MDTSILPPELRWRGASERLVARADHPWITPAEISSFESTPNYSETIGWLQRLCESCGLVRMETFGVSPEGRDLVAVFVGEDGALDSERPTMFVQAGIHSGEIDGKDAGLMLLRDIALNSEMISGVNLVFVPFVNVDGHERSSEFSRPNQRGPSHQGWRTTAQNLNLNRDYAKLDSPELRAVVKLLRRCKADLCLDIHVTDGFDYQYDITYGYVGSNNTYAASANIASWLDSELRPFIDEYLIEEGHFPGDLVFDIDEAYPGGALTDVPFTSRFSHGYGDAVHLPSILVENHSLKPYRQRVLGTYVLLDGCLKLLRKKGNTLRSAAAKDRRSRPGVLPVGWRQTTAPTRERDFLPVSSSRYQSSVSGREEIAWTGRPEEPVRLAQYGVESTISLVRPTAYWVPATKPAVIEVLRLHGIRMKALTAAQLVRGDVLRLRNAKRSDHSEGRSCVTAGTPETESVELWFGPKSVRVPTDQPLGDLAMILLEPQSEDSLFAWGFFNEILERVEYIEPYVIAPLAERMLTEDARLKSEFEAKLRDQTFAQDPKARLQWFYERSPYADRRYLVYPVLIEP